MRQDSKRKGMFMMQNSVMQVWVFKFGPEGTSESRETNLGTVRVRPREANLGRVRTRPHEANLGG